MSQSLKNCVFNFQIQIVASSRVTEPLLIGVESKNLESKVKTL